MSVQSESIIQGKIYAAIVGVMKDVGVVAKEKEFESPIGKKGNYMFRGIDDVMNALHPAMVNNRIFVVPEILEQIREQRASKSGTQMQVSICRIKYTFFADDGSSVSAIVTGEGMDTGDKATNKAMSIAFKYACFQVFCIPTEEMQDPDGERPELETTKEKKESGTKKQQQNNTAENPPYITKAMLDTLKTEQKRTGVTDKQILGLKSISAKNIESLSIEEFRIIMDKFGNTPDLPGGEKNE